MGRQVSARWGTSSLELGLGPQSPGAERGTAEGQGRRAGSEGITGAVLRHRMLPFLISMRLEKMGKKSRKGALRTGLVGAVKKEGRGQ